MRLAHNVLIILDSLFVVSKVYAPNDSWFLNPVQINLLINICNSMLYLLRR